MGIDSAFASGALTDQHLNDVNAALNAPARPLFYEENSTSSAALHRADVDGRFWSIAPRRTEGRAGQVDGELHANGADLTNVVSSVAVQKEVTKRSHSHGEPMVDHRRRAKVDHYLRIGRDFCALDRLCRGPPQPSRLPLQGRSPATCQPLLCRKVAI